MNENPKADQRTLAFLKLLSKHEKRTNSFIFAAVSNYFDAEEVIQLVRLRLWEEFEKYDPSKDFGAWSRAIAYYQILAYREKMGRKREQAYPEFLESIANAAIETSDEEYSSRTKALERCIDKLSESNRDLIMQAYFGQNSLRQVANKVGRTYNATKMAVVRIRNLLGACVEKEMKNEEAS